MGFSQGLRTQLNAKLGHHVTSEFEGAIMEMGRQMVELANRLDKALVRIEHLERNASTSTKAK